MDDIFISYARDDREKVERLERKLEEFGFRCWWDRELTAGKQFRDEIIRRLEGARCVIVAWSPHSAASPWVQDEADRALKANKYLPILVGKCDPPPPFGQMQTLDLSGALNSDNALVQADAWADLNRAVKSMTGGRTVVAGGKPSPSKPEPKKKASMASSSGPKSGGGSTLALVATSVVALAVGAVGATLVQNVMAKPGGALPYSVSALPEDVQKAVLEARAQRAAAQKNADEALKKAKMALFYAGQARKGGDPSYEARVADAQANFYAGQRLEPGVKKLGVTNVPDPSGDHAITYSGEHDGTLFGGYGVRVIDASEYLQGQFHDGVPNGPGVLILTDRGRYEGYFDKDKQDGHAVAISPSGDVSYEGKWKSGERDGPGVEWREGGCVYVAGSWSVGRITSPKEGRLCTPEKTS